MPSSVITEIERIMCRFLWEGHKSSKVNRLVKWEIASKDTHNGGIGVGNIKNKNTAFLFKWN